MGAKEASRSDRRDASFLGLRSCGEPLACLFDIYTREAEQILTEDLTLRLFGELRVAVAFDEVLRNLEVPEGVERPLGVPDRGLRAVDDLVLPAPEHELADPLRELPGRADDEVDGRRDRSVQIRVAHELPARLVYERQSHVEDDEVYVREIRGRPVHVPRLRRLDGLWPERDALVDPDEVDPQLLRLLVDGESDLRVVHAPGKGLAVIVADVVELERLSPVLIDLYFHILQSLAALQRIDRSPEDCTVRVLVP